jgi:hypothetical protein
MKGKSTVAHAGGRRLGPKTDPLVKNQTVRSEVVYAPTAMNPACPQENSPIYPLTRFRLEDIMILTPTNMSTN